LVRFLAVLAPALAISLASQAAVPGAAPARFPKSERKINKRKHVIHATALLLGPARCQYDYRPRLSQQTGRLFQIAFGYSVIRSTRAGQYLDTI